MTRRQLSPAERRSILHQSAEGAAFCICPQRRSTVPLCRLTKAGICCILREEKIFSGCVTFPVRFLSYITGTAIKQNHLKEVHAVSTAIEQIFSEAYRQPEQQIPYTGDSSGDEAIIRMFTARQEQALTETESRYGKWSRRLAFRILLHSHEVGQPGIGQYSVLKPLVRSHSRRNIGILISNADRCLWKISADKAITGLSLPSESQKQYAFSLQLLKYGIYHGYSSCFFMFCKNCTQLYKFVI